MKINNIFILFIIVFIILIIFIVLTLNNNLKDIKQVCFKNKCFNVELAQTPEEKKIGLMYRQKLDFNAGMLFVYEKEGEYSFWMKNTLIPLDIIWINKNKEVVFIKENIQPCLEKDKCESVNPNKVASYVLELNAGIINEINLKIGDKLIFR